MDFIQITNKNQYQRQLLIQFFQRLQTMKPNDMKIIHEGRPELEVGFRQSKFKVGDHGAVHDLPYTVKSNGGTKTEKSDDNKLKMMGSIVDMPNRNNVE